MRSFSPTTAAYLAARSDFQGHILLWVSARNRASGAVEEIGFWTGVDHEEFLIEGQSRLYYAAGSMLSMDALRRQVGLKAVTQRVTLSQISPEVQQLIRGYDPRHCPVEVHRALFDPQSDRPVDAPHVILRGFIDKVTLTTPAKGERGSVTIEIASHARALTKPVSRYRSDATLRARAPTDAFRQYASITDAVEVKWGS